MNRLILKRTIPMIKRYNSSPGYNLIDLDCRIELLENQISNIQIHTKKMCDDLQILKRGTFDESKYDSICNCLENIDSKVNSLSLEIKEIKKNDFAFGDILFTFSILVIVYVVVRILIDTIMAGF